MYQKSIKSVSKNICFFDKLQEFDTKKVCGTYICACVLVDVYWNLCLPMHFYFRIGLVLVTCAFLLLDDFVCFFVRLLFLKYLCTHIGEFRF